MPDFQEYWRRLDGVLFRPIPLRTGWRRRTGVSSSGSSRLAYGGVEVDHDRAVVVFSDGRRMTGRLPGHDQNFFLQSLVEKYAAKHRAKVVAAGLVAGDGANELGAALWLENDVVPVWGAAADARGLMDGAREAFDEAGIARVRMGVHREIVDEPLIPLEDQWRTALPEERRWLEEQVKRFGDKRIVYVSATPRGGGVALMRHAMMRLYRSLGVDGHWHVMIDRADAFDITKRKFHNVLQAVASPDTRLTEEDKQLYLDWTADNATELKPVFARADVVVIDDPQPCGLIPYVRKVNPEAKIIYRSHIQIEAKLADTAGTPQHETWQFLWQFIRQADVFAAHPVRSFVPKGVAESKLVFMPATGDPLDGLNKPLTRSQSDYYRKIFNNFLASKGQTPLDASRPYVTQIARFDPSKGIPDVLEAYRSLRVRMEREGRVLPQLVVAGFGSIDDPDGVVILDMTMAMLQQDRFASMASDVKIARLPSMDQLLNMLMRESNVVLQLSHKEGYEEKVSTALMMGRPVVVYNAGGIPLQVRDRENGYVVEVGDTDAVAEKLYQLLTDDGLYGRMSQAAATKFNRHVMTIANATKWLYLASDLVEHGHINRHDPRFDQIFSHKVRE